MMVLRKSNAEKKTGSWITERFTVDSFRMKMLSLALAFTKMGEEYSSEWLSLPHAGLLLQETIILLSWLWILIYARN